MVNAKKACNKDTKSTLCDDLVMSAPLPISLAFGFSYASWFVVPRVLLEAMPGEWQHRFVGVIDELIETFDWEVDSPPLAVFQVGCEDQTPAIPPEYLNNYRHPDKKWLESITIHAKKRS